MLLSDQQTNLKDVKDLKKTLNKKTCTFKPTIVIVFSIDEQRHCELF